MVGKGQSVYLCVSKPSQAGSQRGHQAQRAVTEPRCSDGELFGWPLIHSQDRRTVFLCLWAGNSGDHRTTLDTDRRLSSPGRPWSPSTRPRGANWENQAH